MIDDIAAVVEPVGSAILISYMSAFVRKVENSMQDKSDPINPMMDNLI